MTTQRTDNPAAIALRAPDEPTGDGGIDPELAEALLDAIVDYPSFTTACAACGVTTRAVKSMLERGVGPGAPPSLRAFTKTLARRDADNALRHNDLRLLLLQQGNAAGARLIGDIIKSRWCKDDEPTIMDMLTSGRRTEALKARLDRPGPLLGALLATQLKSPNELWAGLLSAAGWVRAMPQETPSGPPADEQGDTEPAGQESDEPDPEDDGGPGME